MATPKIQTRVVHSSFPRTHPTASAGLKKGSAVSPQVADSQNTVASSTPIGDTAPAENNNQMSNMAAMLQGQYESNQ